MKSPFPKRLRLLRRRVVRSRFFVVGRDLWQRIDRYDLFTHVAALTYTTVLSVVPLLALLIAVGRGFGLDRYLEQQLRAQLNAPDDVMNRLIDFADSYISRTHDDIVVGVSLLVLAFTLVSLVNNIERRFNAMWGIRTSRSLFGFSLSYLGLMVFLVFAIFFLSGVWLFVLRLFDYLPHYSLVDRGMPFLLWTIKALAVSGVFALMFKYIPLTEVRWRVLALPALLTGFLFCAVQDVYISSQLFLSGYNAVYGSFAILPLLMMWLYVTWTICLGGVALCSALACGDGASLSEEAPRLSRAEADAVALRVMGLLARRFMRGESTPTVGELSAALFLPSAVTLDALDRLCAAGCLFAVPSSSAVVAARAHRVYKIDTDVHILTAAALLRRLDKVGAPLSFTQALPEVAAGWRRARAFRGDWTAREEEAATFVYEL